MTLFYFPLQDDVITKHWHCKCLLEVSLNEIHQLFVSELVLVLLPSLWFSVHSWIKEKKMSTTIGFEIIHSTSGFDNESLALDPSPSMSIVPIIWTILIIVGAVGNGLVLYIVFRYGERSVTNIYIINLALADLAFILIVVPITATSFAMPTWGFGDGMCKFFTFTIYVSFNWYLLQNYRAIFEPRDSNNWYSSVSKVSLFQSRPYKSNARFLSWLL